MAAWLLPALKAVLPHVGTLINVAAPVFTHKSALPHLVVVGVFHCMSF